MHSISSDSVYVHMRFTCIHLHVYVFFSLIAIVFPFQHSKRRHQWWWNIIYIFSLKNISFMPYFWHIFTDRNKNKLTKWKKKKEANTKYSASINCCSLMRTQRNNKTEMSQRSSFAFYFIWLVLFLVVNSLSLSVCLSLLYYSSLAVPWVSCFFSGGLS